VPRFHFNAIAGERVIPDPEGEECPSIVIARQEAMLSARESLLNAIRSGEEPAECIQVIDDDGRVVLTVPLTDLLPKSLRNWVASAD
jgi:hypothetical protein